MDADEVIRTKGRHALAVAIIEHQQRIYEGNAAGAARDAADRVWQRADRLARPPGQLARVATETETETEAATAARAKAAREQAAAAARAEPLLWEISECPRRIDGRWTVVLAFPDGRFEAGPVPNSSLVVGPDDTVGHIVDGLGQIWEASGTVPASS